MRDALPLHIIVLYTVFVIRALAMYIVHVHVHVAQWQSTRLENRVSWVRVPPEAAHQELLYNVVLCWFVIDHVFSLYVYMYTMYVYTCTMYM